MSPVSGIAHVLAIALGLWGGFWVMGRVAPDLPADETDPGVEAATELRGGDPDSLLRAGPLAIALDQLSDQIAAGDAIVSLRVEPGSIDAQSGSGGLDLEPGEIPPGAPERIVAEIARQRPQVSLDNVMFIVLRPAEQGPEWYVQLDFEIDPPRTYVAPLDGSSATAGG
jgi:hypothetical protein